MVALTDLPPELLIKIPTYLSLDDLRASILTCRTVYATFNALLPSELLEVASSTDGGLGHYRHLIFALRARRLAAWAACASQNLFQFQLAICSGINSAFILALEKTGPIMLTELLRLRNIENTILDPLAAHLRVICAAGLDAAGSRCDHCTDVKLSLANYWIYCELFKESIMSNHKLLEKPANGKDCGILLSDWSNLCVCEDCYNPTGVATGMFNVMHVLAEGVKREVRRVLGKHRNQSDYYSLRFFKLGMTHEVERAWWTASVVGELGLSTLNFVARNISEGGEKGNVPSDIMAVLEHLDGVKTCIPPPKGFRTWICRNCSFLVDFPPS